jgi:hypothetical protein
MAEAETSRQRFDRLMAEAIEELINPPIVRAGDPPKPLFCERLCPDHPVYVALRRQCAQLTDQCEHSTSDPSLLAIPTPDQSLDTGLQAFEAQEADPMSEGQVNQGQAS